MLTCVRIFLAKNNTKKSFIFINFNALQENG